MTKQQKARIEVSPAQLSMLKKIRATELALSGRGVQIASIIEPNAGRTKWITLQALVRRELLRLDDENRVRTTGLARTINPSWWATNG